MRDTFNGWDEAHAAFLSGVGSPIYSSINTGLPDVGSNFPVAHRRRRFTLASPLSQEFHVNGPTTLSELFLRISIANPNDGDQSLSIWFRMVGQTSRRTAAPNFLARH